ncbi:MMPL family transporter [Plantactinospora sp. DSM 117369]
MFGLAPTARACVRHRWLVLLGWAVLTAALLGLAGALPSTARVDFRMPGSESQRAADLLAEAGFGDLGAPDGTLVVAAPAGVRDPAVRAALDGLLHRLDEVPGVSVGSPYQPPGGQVSADGRIGTAEIGLGPGASAPEQAERAAQVSAIRDAFDAPGITVELAGDAFAETSAGGLAEGVGLLAAAVILLVAFGSLIAAGLPLLVAVVGVGCGSALLVLLRHVVTMPDFAIYLTVMIGLGVGIDYALLVVTRYRSALARGVDVPEAVVEAMETAGRSVLFAGTTVIIAVSGMLFLGPELGGGLALAAGCGVLLVMLAALTLLPALLGLVGRRIDRFGLPHRRSTGHPTVEPHPGVAAVRSAPAYRWSRVVQRRPWLLTSVALGLLVLLTLPALELRLGWSDASDRPTSDTTRRAYDLVTAGFGPGANGPLLLVAADPAGGADPAKAADTTGLRGAARAVADTPGVVAISEVVPLGGGISVAVVTPRTGPQAAETGQLVHRLRDEVLPPFAEPGFPILVSGANAAGIDFAELSVRRLPWLAGAVLVASFLLLTVVFRSLLVPLKAVLVNLLSVGAAYGVIVAIFQWGWLAGPLGTGDGGPVDAWVPTMLFVVVFGLSMDYEVFLLSRIREEYLRTRDNAGSVADGLAATARVITAAAAIMVCVFVAFAAFDDRSLKMMGIGLATAVLVDATIVRLVLVPAAMQLLGDRNWWLPGRRTPRA